jgi:formamidase
MADHVLDDPGDRAGTAAPFHNRWHPGIAPVLRVAPGDRVELDTRDALDGQITRGSTVEDVARAQLERVHPLTGPIAIDGAAPGDLLAVHIERIVPAEHGWTATFPGGGLLPDLFPGPLLALWELEHGYAVSEQVPGVRIPAAPFPGVVGVAPSRERLRAVNAREQRVVEAGNRVATPTPVGAVPADPAINVEAWRTPPARELGGNVDIRQLVAGSTVYLPVDVPDALFSIGDAHFAQGDGECCGSAIETNARITLRFELLDGEAQRRGQTQPTLLVPPAAFPRHETSGWYGTTGLSLRPDGEVGAFDATQAARNALTTMIAALAYDHELTREQAYLVASLVGDLRISAIVNAPHAQVAMFVPQIIFQSDRECDAERG